MKNKIAFVYNPYTYFESYKNVLNNVRKHYPTADVFIYFDSFRDDIQKYNDVAHENNCTFDVRQEKMFYIYRGDPVDVNEPKMIEWISRVKNACENTDAEWILLLEDDVLIKKDIEHWPSSDCGKNRGDVGFLGGGSIFRRQKFLESLYKIDIAFIIKQDPDTSWAGDHLLSYVFRLNGATEEKWVELAEPGYYDNEPHAVYHGYKDLHNK